MIDLIRKLKDEEEQEKYWFYDREDWLDQKVFSIVSTDLVYWTWQTYFTKSSWVLVENHQN